MSRKAIIFDLDGTLVDLSIDWDTVKKSLEREFGRRFKSVTSALLKLSSEGGHLLERAFELIEGVELKSAKSIGSDRRLFDLLKKLKDQKLKLGLVTMQGEKPAEEILRRLGIKELFDTIVTRETTVIRQEQLKAALRLLRARPAEATFIADRISDMEAALRLGLQRVAVTSKKGVNCDFRISSIYELGKLSGALLER